MRNLVTIILLFISICGYSTEPDGAKALALGKKMFRLEKASWSSTDHFLAAYPGRVDSIGGYLSYMADDGYVYSIFYSRFDSSNILARYKFDGLPGKMPKSVDIDECRATELELSLIMMRQDALKQVLGSVDGFFSYYENTSFNFIPIIEKNTRVVYIVTAPREHGYVLLGNDYKLTYNRKYKLKKKEKLHNTIIKLPYSNEKGKIETTMYSHVLSEIIDPTDICTLLLYRELVDWDKHIVLGKRFVSIFDMTKEKITVMDRETYFELSN